MTDLMDKAASFISKRRNAALATSVRYVCEEGELSTLPDGNPLKATYAENQRITEDVTTNVQVTETIHDFMFRRADLALGGKVREPQPGDFIFATIRGEERRFSVMGLPGLPQTENPDSFGYDLRVHTQEVLDS